MKRLSELSLEELLKSKARITAVLIIYAILILIAVAIYGYIRFVKSGSITFIPFGVLPLTLIPVVISLKNLTNEIKYRQSYKKNNGSEV